MTEEEARRVAQQALAFARAENTEITVRGQRQGATRFANNAITQNVAKTDATLTVRSAYGNNVGQASTNNFGERSLQAAVERAEEIARLSQPDTEYMPPVEPGAAYPTVHGYDEATAQARPQDRAAAIHAGIGLVEAQGQKASGSYATNSYFTGVANSRGLWAWNRSTAARAVCTVITPDSSGWASASDTGGIDVAETARTALERALLARGLRTPEAKTTAVVLTPEAAADMLGFLPYSMDAKSADEGRSAFSGKLGQKIMGDSVTITSAPGDPQTPGTPFDDSGMPLPDVAWIRGGVLENLATGRYWAQKTGRPFTGYPGNVLMAGDESKTTEDLIASVEDGVFVTRFWYIRFVDPMKLLLTGMTRDGLYKIENGRVAYGLKHLRFHQSPIDMLASAQAPGRPKTMGGYRMPPLIIPDFHFTSGTTF